ncbi:MAG: type I DNA topoisomerase [Firmicutes bacterium]|nr:type I DNA topoisomerase [Bacillota bacterium]
MKLIIIEGAGKKETIEKYLGDGYRVFATKGHIRDLPPKPMSVDIKNNFAPSYKPLEDKLDIISNMQNLANKASEVLLATDPDREGEAISWHVAHLLGIPQDKKARIVFNEISKKAVNAALVSPRPINMDLVDAQQARRVLDRLVGYKVSPYLNRRVAGGKLSAGRVQSATLKLIVDRDREIAAFIPEEYWNFASILNKNDIDFKAVYSYEIINDKETKVKLVNAEQVEALKSQLDGKDYIVKDVKKSITYSKPAPPFITSSMQQDALNKLGMNLKQTSSAAQVLYEGVELPGEGKVALVTYIRTDSTRVSPDAQKEALSFISQKFGKDYSPEKPNFYASKKGSQDAHEAIRPISLDRTPESLKGKIKPDQLKLYTLIYNRFLASQMTPAKYDSLTIDILNGIHGFKVNGRTMLFPGFTAVYKAFEEEKEGDENAAKLPEISKGDNLKFIEYKYEQKFTKPPAYYTEASLVKTMEDKGIGRPATYTPTIATLFFRQYVNKDGKYIKAAQLGYDVTDWLVKYFENIVNVKFTADMEEKLDDIEDGNKEWQAVIADFYKGFEADLKKVGEDKQEPEPSDYNCPECGQMLMYKMSRFGKFLSCSGYPNCKYSCPIDSEGKPTERQKAEVTDIVCDKCGQMMVKRKGKFGDFVACPGFPKCKNILNTGEKKAVVEGGACPDCGKMTVQKRARSIFYGCSGYPECKFTSSHPVVDGKCDKCNGFLMHKKLQSGEFFVCGIKGCDFKKDIVNIEENTKTTV